MAEKESCVADRFVEINPLHGFPVSNRSSDTIITWKKGQADVFDGRLLERKTIELHELASAISVSPNMPLIGFSGNTSFGLISTSGKEHVVMKPERLLAENRYCSRFGTTCGFSWTGSRFWAVTNDKLYVIDVENRKLSGMFDLDYLLPYSEAVVSPLAFPDESILALSVAAGQDFCGVFFVRMDGDGFEWMTEPRIMDSAVVAFEPQSKDILSIHPARIKRIGFPTGVVHERVDLTAIFPEDKDGYVDDNFGDYGFFLKNGSVLVASGEGKQLLFESAPMRCKTIYSLQIAERLKIETIVSDLVNCSPDGRLVAYLVECSRSPRRGFIACGDLG